MQVDSTVQFRGDLLHLETLSVFAILLYTSITDFIFPLKVDGLFARLIFQPTSSTDWHESAILRRPLAMAMAMANISTDRSEPFNHKRTHSRKQISQP